MLGRLFDRSFIHFTYTYSDQALPTCLLSRIDNQSLIVEHGKNTKKVVLKDRSPQLVENVRKHRHSRRRPEAVCHLDTRDLYLNMYVSKYHIHYRHNVGPANTLKNKAPVSQRITTRLSIAEAM